MTDNNTRHRSRRQSKLLSKLKTVKQAALRHRIAGQTKGPVTDAVSVTMNSKVKGVQTDETQSPESTGQAASYNTHVFTAMFGVHGFTSLFRNGSMMWPHGLKALKDSTIPSEVTAYGAEICSSNVDRLEAYESVISAREPFMQVGIKARKPDGKIDKDYYIEYDQARLGYRSLLLDIIIDAVNAARLEEESDARGMTMHRTLPLQLDGKIISPLETMTVFDEDLATPAMTIYLPSNLAAETFRIPRGSYYNAFKTEMVLQMKLNDKLLYQGMAFDDVLAKHRTDIGVARYLMPAERDGFVADMVRLLQSHTDHREVFDTAIKTSHWSSSKYPNGAVVEDRR